MTMAELTEEIEENLADHERCAEIAAEYGAQNTDGPSSAVRALGHLLENQIVQYEAELARANAAESRVRELEALINAPRVDDFFQAVRVEAVHQVERWGVEHDAGKRTEDWIALMTYLLGKAATAYWAGNREKLLHHVITGAAVCMNWHHNLTGADTRMRPGIADGQADDDARG